MKRMVFLMVVVVLLIAGCGGNDPEQEIVGHWIITVPIEPLVDTMEFFPDNTVTIGLTNFNGNRQVDSGEWEINGEELCIKFESSPDPECNTFKLDDNYLDLGGGLLFYRAE